MFINIILTYSKHGRFRRVISHVAKKDFSGNRTGRYRVGNLIFLLTLKHEWCVRFMRSQWSFYDPLGFLLYFFPQSCTLSRYILCLNLLIMSSFSGRVVFVYRSNLIDNVDMPAGTSLGEDNFLKTFFVCIQICVRSEFYSVVEKFLHQLKFICWYGDIAGMSGGGVITSYLN